MSHLVIYFHMFSCCCHTMGGLIFNRPNLHNNLSAFTNQLYHNCLGVLFFFYHKLQTLEKLFENSSNSMQTSE